MIREKRLTYFNQILKMDNSRLVKQVIFSDALEGRRKSGRPLLSWRHSISQDMKFFGLQDIMTRDDYSPIIGQSKLGKVFADADEHWKHKKKLQRIAKHKGCRLVLV